MHEDKYHFPLSYNREEVMFLELVASIVWLPRTFCCIVGMRESSFMVLQMDLDPMSRQMAKHTEASGAMARDLGIFPLALPFRQPSRCISR